MGLTAGINLNNVSLSYRDVEEPKTNFRTGFEFGLTSYNRITESFAIKSSLLYSSKGYSNGDVAEDWFDRYIFNYVCLPVNLLVYFEENWHVGFGPFLGVGVSGRNKFGTGNFTTEYELIPSDGKVNELDFSRDQAPFRRIDYGIGAGLGYDLNDLMLSVNYNHSLSNISVDILDGTGTSFEVNDFEAFHRNVTFSITYFPR